MVWAFVSFSFIRVFFSFLQILSSRSHFIIIKIYNSNFFCFYFLLLLLLSDVRLGGNTIFLSKSCPTVYNQITKIKKNKMFISQKKMKWNDSQDEQTMNIFHLTSSRHSPYFRFPFYLFIYFFFSHPFRYYCSFVCLFVFIHLFSSEK